jgi:cation:H+ antiporter
VIAFPSPPLTRRNLLECAAGGPILNEVDRFSLFAMLLGILLTAVYLAGFVERRHKTMLRMGIDSIIVLLAYGGGLVVLFFLR